MHRILYVAPLVLVLSLGAGCDGSGDESQTGATELESLGADFHCDDPIDTLDELPDDYIDVAGVVALPGPETALQRGRAGPDNDLESKRRFSKMGLLLRPGERILLHVGPESQGNALMQWGTTGQDDPSDR